jgi:hypothetical protein
LSPAAVIAVGLVFQVVVSLCIPISHMYGAHYGDMPALPKGQLVGLFVIPYALVVAFAYVAARII